jgi:hypothetical protein
MRPNARNKRLRKSSSVARHVPERERYLLGVDDDEMEKLAQGECPETIALKAFEALKWTREAARNRAREWQVAADLPRRRRRVTL